MTVLLTQPVSLKASQPTLSPGLQIPDAAVSMKATLNHWTGANTVTCSTEMSFDDGVNWHPMAMVGPSTSPSGTFKNRTDLWIQVDVWKMCSCGEVYIPNHPANPQLLVHSDHAFQDISQLADLSSISFHNPDTTPATGLPLRQVRVQATASGNVSSQLIVEWF